MVKKTISVDTSPERVTLSIPTSHALQYAVMGIVSVLLAISNPNLVQFHAYCNQNYGFFEKLLCRSEQSSNYVLFSFYDINCNDTSHKRYLGIAGNFILLDSGSNF